MAVAVDYTWTIAVCPTCGEHVGWRYDHQPENDENDDNDDTDNNDVDDDDGSGHALLPLQQFFGIRRDVVSI